MSLVALLLLACADDPAPPRDTPPPEDTSAADSADTAAPYTDGCEGAFYDGRVNVQAVEATCDDAAHVRYAVRTQGWAGYADLLVVETAVEAPDVPFGPGVRTEESVLGSVASDTCGEWDQLEQELELVADDVAPTPDETTHFTCAAWDADTVTLLLTVYDVTGAPSDCVLLGHDPIGMQDRLYDEWFPPTHAGRDLRACVIYNGFTNAR